MFFYQCLAFPPRLLPLDLLLLFPSFDFDLPVDLLDLDLLRRLLLRPPRFDLDFNRLLRVFDRLLDKEGR